MKHGLRLRPLLLLTGIFAAGLLFAGCSDAGDQAAETEIVGTDLVQHLEVKTYAYAAYDTNGRLLVTGRLRIAVGDSGKVSNNVSGKWELTRMPGVLPQETGPQDGNGNLTGIVWEGEMERISMNLNPNFVDNNVILAGTLVSGRMSGTWSYIGFPGVIAKGPFVATLVP